jgi:hypothetical protein
VTGQRPCSAAEAVQRALSLVAAGTGQYELGTGDYRPRVVAGVLVDEPWTENGGRAGSDCAGFAECWAYKLTRHRPGYNRGPWSTCSDDLNCNSAIEDAQHARDLFAVVTDAPAPGDLIAYPTIRLVVNGHAMEWCGHVCIVVGVSRAASFDITKPDWSLLDVAQCCGPNGRAPAVIASDGSIWNAHDHVWPKPEHRSWLLRAVP